MLIKTQQKKQVVDITDDIERELQKQNFQDGCCHAFALHTTCAITTADLDPGTDLDMLDAFEAMIPKLHYRHPHDPAHVGDHIMSSVIGPSLTLPVEGGRLVLGQWQRVVLIEFSGPREREIRITFLG